MNKLTDPKIMWTVSTEGDCEGKSIRQIGTFQGALTDLVKTLAGHACYKLYFKEVVNEKLPEPRVLSEREVQFSVQGMSQKEVVNLAREEGLNMTFGTMYEAIAYAWTPTEQLEMERKSALAKLTDKEKKLLNLE